MIKMFGNLYQTTNKRLTGAEKLIKCQKMTHFFVWSSVLLTEISVFLTLFQIITVKKMTLYKQILSVFVIWFTVLGVNILQNASTFQFYRAHTDKGDLLWLVSYFLLNCIHTLFFQNYQIVHVFRPTETNQLPTILHFRVQDSCQAVLSMARFEWNT